MRNLTHLAPEPASRFTRELVRRILATECVNNFMLIFYRSCASICDHVLFIYKLSIK